MQDAKTAEGFRMLFKDSAIPWIVGGMLTAASSGV